MLAPYNRDDLLQMYEEALPREARLVNTDMTLAELERQHWGVHLTGVTRFDRPVAIRIGIPEPNQRFAWPLRLLTEVDGKTGPIAGSHRVGDFVSGETLHFSRFAIGEEQRTWDSGVAVTSLHTYGLEYDFDSQVRRGNQPNTPVLPRLGR